MAVFTFLLAVIFFIQPSLVDVLVAMDAFRAYIFKTPGGVLFMTIKAGHGLMRTQQRECIRLMLLQGIGRFLKAPDVVT